MKNRIIALVATLALCFSFAPAQAQVTTDPVANALLAKILVNQVIQTNQQMGLLPKEILSESHLMDQVSQMVTDHVSVSDILKGLGSDLVTSITKNNDVMYKTTVTDTKMNDEFKRLIPDYAPGQDYLQYVNILQKNSFDTYSQALGVANDGVSGSTAIADKLKKLLKEPPDTQLKALQQILTVGNMQVQQMDKLIKIQAAMMKSMAVSYQQHNAGSDGYIPKGGVTNYSVNQYCTTTLPMYAFLDPQDKKEAFGECKKSMLNKQNSTK